MVFRSEIAVNTNSAKYCASFILERSLKAMQKSSPGVALALTTHLQLQPSERQEGDEKATEMCGEPSC